MVMGGDLRSRDCGYWILDGHCFTYVVVGIVKFYLKRQKINEKGGWEGKFFKRKKHHWRQPK